MDSLPTAYKTNQADEQAAQLEDLLNLAPSARLLDVPCSYGRLVLAFTKRGHDVTGIDRNKDYLDRTRRALHAIGADATLINQDMRSLAVQSRYYDLALCCGSSIGYYREEDDRRLFSAMYDALKPGGHIVIDTDGYEWLMTQAPRRHWYAGDAGWFALAEFVQRDMLRGRIRMNHHFLNPIQGIAQQATVDCRAYTAHELAALLGDAGFEDIKALSPATLKPYSSTSVRLLLVARRSN